MNEKILEHYLTAAFYINTFLKNAKLSQEQYKSVMKNQYLLKQLQDDNLIDEFYKAIPLMPDDEIEKMLLTEKENQKDKGKLSHNKQIIIDQFISVYGKEQLNSSIDNIMEEEQNKLEIDGVNAWGDDQDISEITYEMFSYRDMPIKNIILDYLAKSNNDTGVLFDFMLKYITEKRSKSLKNSKDLAISILRMFKFILTRKDMDESVIGNYEEAKKIRNSDKFDYLFEGNNEENAISLFNKTRDEYIALDNKRKQEKREEKRKKQFDKDNMETISNVSDELPIEVSKNPSADTAKDEATVNEKNNLKFYQQKMKNEEDKKAQQQEEDDAAQ